MPGDKRYCNNSMGAPIDWFPDNEGVGTTFASALSIPALRLYADYDFGRPS